MEFNHLVISTTDSVPNETITEYKGVVFDRVVARVGLLTDFFAGLTDVFGGRSGKMEKQMDDLYNSLLQGMAIKARSMNA